MFVVIIIATIAGMFIPVSAQYSQQVLNGLNSTVTQNKANGTLAEYIFINNFSICLAMFIPLIGAFFGIAVLVNTGVALGIEFRAGASGASGAASSISPLTAIFALTLVGVVFLLEYVSYSIGITESVWLFRRLMQRRWRELENTGILIAIVAALLIIGAIVETWAISMGF